VILLSQYVRVNRVFLTTELFTSFDADRQTNKWTCHDISRLPDSTVHYVLSLTIIGRSSTVLRLHPDFA